MKFFIEPTQYVLKEIIKGLYLKAEKNRSIVFPGVTEKYEEYDLYDQNYKLELKILNFVFDKNFLILSKKDQ